MMHKGLQFMRCGLIALAIASGVICYALTVSHAIQYGRL